MPLLPLNLCGERTIRLAFVELYSKCVVQKNLFIPHNDPEREVPLQQKCQRGGYLI